ncbi:hypothetical protein N6H14_13310 [Paenibacillus sp. CC-CFT747]|nr:hypothetical protein N6H14_13310 [Paenibacillus sp. CC-CFT747]
MVGIILAQWTRPFQPFSFKGRWITWLIPTGVLAFLIFLERSHIRGDRLLLVIPLWLVLIVVLEYLDRKLYRTFINDNPLADELDE